MEVAANKNSKDGDGPCLSFIVPVYDVSRYLAQCLESLVSQSLDDCEIILINDCSPDPRDDEICRAFEARHEQVIYQRHEENKRQGGARNTGLRLAKGRYVWFVDSDDYVDVYAGELLCEFADAHQLDVVAFSGTTLVDGRFQPQDLGYYYYRRDVKLLNRVLDGRAFIEAALPLGSFLVTPWAHLFRREFLKGLAYRENVIYEDVDFVAEAIHKSARVCAIDYSPYYRRLRAGSVTQSTMDARGVCDSLASVNALIEYIIGEGLEEPDPLIDFVARQFEYRAEQYHDFPEKTDALRGLYEEIEEKYRRHIAPRARQILTPEEREAMRAKSPPDGVNGRQGWSAHLGSRLKRLFGRV